MIAKNIAKYRMSEVIGAISQKLAGASMRPGRVSKELRLDVTTTSQGGFPTWTTIKLGTHESVGDLSSAIMNSGMGISYWAVDILKTITLVSVKTQLELVRVSVHDLGLKGEAMRAQIYLHAMKNGLRLVPSETGPQLRWQYANQASDELLLVGMEPILDSGREPCVFGVVHNQAGRCLYAYSNPIERLWRPDSQWVFGHQS